MGQTYRGVSYVTYLIVRREPWGTGIIS